MRTLLVVSLPLILPGQVVLRLEELERMALERNPAIAQADASVRAAEGRRVQAGLYPNPIFGANGDEINPGPVTRLGEWGGFVEQRIVTAGKLGVNRRLAMAEVGEARARADAERHRVRNLIGTLYYQALADQKLLDVRTELSAIARNSVRIAGELANIGLADKPDVLAAEIEAARAEFGLAMARNAQSRTWRQMSAAVDRTLEIQALEGDLEKVPRLDLDQAMARIEKDSPELAEARTAAGRSELALQRERIAPIPDIQVRAGLRYNRELIELNFKPAGVESFFDIGVEIPLFNRNQGNRAAARAELERAKFGVERLRLDLRARLASVFKEYSDATAAITRYRDEMIPRAEQAYQLYLRNFRQMAAAYPQALMTQRNLFQLRDEYVMVLANAWRAVVEIQGLLIAPGMGAGAMSGTGEP